jgi:hypothetical protein
MATHDDTSHTMLLAGAFVPENAKLTAAIINTWLSGIETKKRHRCTEDDVYRLGQMLILMHGIGGALPGLDLNSLRDIVDPGAEPATPTMPSSIPFTVPTNRRRQPATAGGDDATS